MLLSKLNLKYIKILFNSFSARLKNNLKRAELQADREHTTKLVGMILKPITEVMTTVTGSKAIQMGTSGFKMLAETVKKMFKFFSHI